MGGKKFTLCEENSTVSSADNPWLLLVSCKYYTDIQKALLIQTGCVTSIFHTALMCPMLTAPQNGTIRCPMGRSTGSMCTFTCDTGFTLIGSSRRICRTTTAWTGTLTFCRPLQCVPLEPPENGVIVAPCRRDYTSTCSILCTFGYTLEGPSVQTCILDSQSGGVRWTEPPMCICEF